MKLLKNKVRFLIIRFSSIGDIVLTTPLVRCLKHQVQDSEICFLTSKKFVPVIKANPYISRVYEYEGNIFRLISVLRPEAFDYIIDLQNNYLSKIFKICLCAPFYTVNKINFTKFLIINFKINRLPASHIVDRYLDTVSHFGVKNDLTGLDFFIPENEKFDINNLPDVCNNGYVAFIISGTYNTKKLPVEKISWICNNINYPVILIGGSDEKKAGDDIVSLTGENVFNFAGKTSICESASLVSCANLVLTNDTGFMHIAAAFGKKILSFWGNTIPGFGMYPYMADQASEVAEVKNLKCRPCSKLGFKRCPKNHFKCMNEIETGSAVDWINKNF